MLWETCSPEETAQLGKWMGEQAVAGEIYCLDGDLGVGKTVFTQGFGLGLGIRGAINSPTFPILQVYETEGRLPLYHFDVYRLTEGEELEELGYEEYFYGGGVCLIEWPERIEEYLPQEAIRISIKKDPKMGFAYRRIELRREGLA